jgi:ABC-type branched-subunit amino acid transport system permease subunit
MAGRLGILAAALAAFAALALLGRVLPNWFVLVATLAFAKGLVALGLVVLMRGGLVSFGQGIFFCAGAYAAGLTMRSLGVSDAVLLVALGGVASLILGLIIAPLLAGYRGIFFATLTLALSMIAYGILDKTYSLGGSDGINLHAPSFLGYQPPTPQAVSYALYALTCLVMVIAAALCRVHFDSLRGLLSLAARDNEIRVEYLGASVRRVSGVNFTIAALLGGIGGALSALSLGHIDPDFTFWTTSGEFVFLAILSGYASVAAVFVSSIIVELVRSFSSQYFPNTWQGALGIFLLLVILFLPQGLGSLVQRRRRSQSQSDLEPAPAPAPVPAETSQ